MTPVVQIRSATKRFLTVAGTAHTAVLDVDLDVEDGEFVAVVGPTGCGKSTTLSLIAGLAAPSDGTVVVDGEPVAGIPDGVGYMFQADAMLPWRTVLANVAAGPRWRGVHREAALARARDWIDRVGLAGFEDYYMHQLSGGMRKRVALAQTLVTEPRLLLMDEPFSALDVQTRALMQDELLRLWSGTGEDGSTGAAVVFVTHDLEEAIVLADRVVVMTTRPARVKEAFPIRLDRPRDVEELRMTPEFVAVYKEVWSCLSSEVAAARGTGARRVA
jgi:NitT/TauT family transport system ATP-binding protein